MENVSVRDMVEEDLQSIETIIARHNATPNKFYTASMPCCRGSMLEGKSQAIFVAISNFAVIGFLNLHWNKPSGDERHKAEFEVLVHPDYRKLSAGRKLLDRAIKFITDKTDVETIVAKIKNGNIYSERLCNNRGFSKVHQDSLGAYWELQITR